MTHTPSPDPHGTGPRRAAATAGVIVALLGALLLGVVVPAPSPAAAGPLVAPTTEEAAGAALDWLEAELAANGGTLPGPAPGTTDWGLGADAALALLAHGRGARPATSSLVDDLLGALDDYTTWDSLGAQYAGVRLAGPLAKALLVAETAGRSTTVDGVDLPSELLGLMAASGTGTGRFGDRNPHGSDGANLIGQSLAILALSHDPAGPPAAAVQFLLSRQCPAGGFPLQSTPGACDDDADADPDATALALDALLCAPRTDGVTTALGRVTGWLLGRADAATGAFGGVGPTAGLNANSTGLVGHALAAAGQTAAGERAAAWLVDQVRLDPPTGSPAEADTGALAYDPAARAAALAGGIDPLLRDQWRRAGTQAVLALGAPPLGVPVDEPPVVPATTTTTTTTTTAAAPTTTTVVPPATTAPSTTPTTAAGSATPATVAGTTLDAEGTGEDLAVTGSTSGPVLVVGIVLLLAGSALVGAGRAGRTGLRGRRVAAGRTGRLLGVLVLLGGLGVVVLGSPPAADASATRFPLAAAGSEGPCPSADGVTVVVDFGPLGGGVHVRCAPGAPASGFDALGRAGVAYDTALRSSGFLCRIAGEPAADPCIDPSPASAHWSYWLAERGGAWCYSNLGAGNRRPPQGTVEGWAFVQGSGAADARPPATAPPAAVTGAGGLAGTDCDRTASAPTAPPATVAPAVVAPPAGQPPTGSYPPPSGPATTLPSGDGTDGSPAPGAGGSDASTPSTPAEVDDTTTSVPGDTAAPPVSGDPALTGSAAATTDDLEGRAGASADQASSVDLSDSGRTGGAGPFGTVAAFGGAAALLAGAVVLRRRRDRPQEDPIDLDPAHPGP